MTQLDDLRRTTVASTLCEQLAHEVDALVDAILLNVGRGSPEDCREFILDQDDTLEANDRRASLLELATGTIDSTATVAPLVPRVRELVATLSQMSTLQGTDDRLSHLCLALLHQQVKVRLIVTGEVQGEMRVTRRCAYAFCDPDLAGVSRLKNVSRAFKTRL